MKQEARLVPAASAAFSVISSSLMSVSVPQSEIAGGVDPGHPTVPFPGVKHRPVYQVDGLLHLRGKQKLPCFLYMCLCVCVCLYVRTTMCVYVCVCFCLCLYLCDSIPPPPSQLLRAWSGDRLAPSVEPN
jgi:hypothetical protein